MVAPPPPNFGSRAAYAMTQRLTYTRMYVYFKNWLYWASGFEQFNSIKNMAEKLYLKRSLNYTIKNTSTYCKVEYVIKSKNITHCAIFNKFYGAKNSTAFLAVMLKKFWFTVVDQFRDLSTASEFGLAFFTSLAESLL